MWRTDIRVCSATSQRRTRLGGGGVVSGGGGGSWPLTVGKQAARASETSNAATGRLAVPLVLCAIHDNPMDVQTRWTRAVAMRHA
jgi:hypothetical protein